MPKVIDHITTNPYLYALAIVVLSILIAAFVDLIVVRVLIRLTRKTNTQLDDEVVKALHKPLFVSVVVAGASLSIHHLGPSDKFMFMADAVLMTLIILLWTSAGMRIGKFILEILAKRMDRHRYIQPRTLPLFEIALKTLVIGLSIYGVFIVWHVDVTAWLASAGVLGIAVGFAAKDTLSNLFSGIFILADAPYKLGDFIILDSGERGQVTDIGVRSTRILTRDDIQIIVPNAAIANAKIINESGGYDQKARVRVGVGVAYGSDIDKVREILLDVAARSTYLVSDPEPRVRFREFGDSSLNFQLLGWINEPILRGRALDELLTAIYKRFKDENIEIPFPQRDIHLKQD